MAKKIEEDEVQPIKIHHGNTRLPYGLCERYGISLPEGATPRQAWEALKGQGITPENVYADLKKKATSELKPEYEIKDAQEQVSKINLEEEKRKFINSDRIKYNLFITKEKIGTAIAYANDEMQSITTKLFNESDIQITDNANLSDFFSGQSSDGVFYSLEDNVVKLSADDALWLGNENTVYNKGEPFYHEMWHAIDFNYGDGLSSSYKLQDGTTFADNLQTDYDNLDIEAIKSEYQQAINEITQKEESAYAEKENRYKELSSKISQLSKEMMQAGMKHDKELELQKMQEARAISQSKEYQELRKEQKKHKTPNATIHNKVSKIWGNISDMVNAKTDGEQDICGLAHSKEYWLSNSKNKTAEAFAEIASAKATNPESYQIIKKYLPNTANAFDEITSRIKEGTL